MNDEVVELARQVQVSINTLNETIGALVRRGACVKTEILEVNRSEYNWPRPVLEVRVLMEVDINVE